MDTAVVPGGTVTDSDAVEECRITLVFDAETYAELEQASGRAGVEKYLRHLVCRFSRWNDTRSWLTELEEAYGPLPPEALERAYRQMLGLANREPSTTKSITVNLDPALFADLRERAGGGPVAPYAQQVLTDHARSGA